MPLKKLCLVTVLCLACVTLAADKKDEVVKVPVKDLVMYLYKPAVGDVELKGKTIQVDIAGRFEKDRAGKYYLGFGGRLIKGTKDRIPMFYFYLATGQEKAFSKIEDNKPVTIRAKVVEFKVDDTTVPGSYLLAENCVLVEKK